MMTAGRAETEATLKLSEIEANIALKKFEMQTYKKEEDQIDYLNARMDQGVTKDLFGENYELTKLQYKLEMFLHLVEYCDASFYYSLSPCTSYTNFQYHSSLDEIIHLTNKMLVEDVDNLNDLYPPPQSFFDKKIEFTWDPQCNDELPRLKTKDSLTQDEMRLIDTCLSSKISHLIDQQSITFSIPLHHKQFNIFDRVRIEEVKILIHGAKTKSGMLTVNIESSGISQDWMDGQNFTFLGDKWRRTFRYDLSSTTSDQYEIKGDIHQSYKNQFNLPTPFTNWIVTIPETHNEGLDLSKVTNIERSKPSLCVSGMVTIQLEP